MKNKTSNPLKERTTKSNLKKGSGGTKSLPSSPGRKKKEEDETYIITLKGLINTVTKDIDLSQDIVDNIELYLRRHYSKGGHPAIILDMDENRFTFGTLGKE